MVVTSTDGYFLTVLGPYLARNNDATILNYMLKSNVEDIKGWFQEDDVFVIDRGFRDSLQLLEELGIKGEMPRLMGKGDKQMSTSDANASRLVTKVS
jgi:GTP-dependent phosphoenolpyruvate carboxykinase